MSWGFNYLENWESTRNVSSSFIGIKFHEFKWLGMHYKNSFFGRELTANGKYATSDGIRYGNDKTTTSHCPAFAELSFGRRQHMHTHTHKYSPGINLIWRG